MSRLRFRLLLAGAALLAVCPHAAAQSEPQPPVTTTPTTPTPPVRPVERDEALVNLPTTLPLAKHHSYFRLTHRFARNLGRGPFGNLAGDLFGLDNGAVIGLEYRYGLTSTLQAGIHRTILGKTIHTFGRWDAVRQSGHSPVSLSATFGIEGQNNLRQDPQPSVSLTLSRTQGALALYATPTYVHNAHTQTLRLLHEGHSHDIPEEGEQLNEIDTVFVGLGARARIRDTVSLVAEVSPRLTGYTPASAVWAVAIEKLTRGHVLQLNFGNSFGTTPAQIARGGASGEVYLGFNLSRKF